MGRVPQDLKDARDDGAMTDFAADLIAFLRARLDEDMQIAEQADRGPWEVGPKLGAHDNRVYVRQQGDLIDSIGTCVFAAQVSNMPQFRANAAHIARHDPARMLREIEAKRQIIEVEQERAIEDGLPERLADRYESDVLRLLALPYADHDDYREEWRP